MGRHFGLGKRHGLCFCVAGRQQGTHALDYSQVRKLLDTNPDSRMTACQALNHPFVQKAPVEFKIFSAKRRFKVSGRKILRYELGGGFWFFVGCGVLHLELSHAGEAQNDHEDY